MLFGTKVFPTIKVDVGLWETTLNVMFSLLETKPIMLHCERLHIQIIERLIYDAWIRVIITTHEQGLDTSISYICIGILRLY